MNPKPRAKKTSLKKYLPLFIVISVLVITLVILLKPQPAAIVLHPATPLTTNNSVFINQIPQKIYPFVADLKNGWPQWSSLDSKDINIQYAYPSTLLGRGAVRSWISLKYGNGTQTITSADPKLGVSFEMNLAERKVVLKGKLVFTPIGSATKVTWVDSDSSHKTTAYMEYMMGQNIQASLNKLKEVSEALWKHPK